MEQAENDYMLMSGIQHFCFCRRQWALIHLEQQWSENMQTAQGRLVHERCHNEQLTEKRGNLLIVRGMRVISHRLRLSGSCDVVEFRISPNGISLQGREGLWLPTPIEYKRGHTKQGDSDRLQLCAQAMALEEMLVCDIPRGALYYAETRRREVVEITEKLRQVTQSMAEEMRRYFDRGYTPKVRPQKHCNACSLKEICLPALYKHVNASEYIHTHVQQATEQAEEVNRA